MYPILYAALKLKNKEKFFDFFKPIKITSKIFSFHHRHIIYAYFRIIQDTLESYPLINNTILTQSLIQHAGNFKSL